jgi:hypothetical protein
MLRVLGIAAVIVIVVAVLAWLFFRDGQYYCFDANRIEETQADIRKELANRVAEKQKKARGGNPRVEVLEVALIKESCKKLTGFVRIKASLNKETAVLEKHCTATMGEGSYAYIWSCD